MITIIGDVHGKVERYLNLINKLREPSIQLGDMGLGFRGVLLPHLPDQHRFFRGNHDSPRRCRAHPSYLGDYGYLEDDQLFWLAGAWSIDRACRTEGVSWWADEELSSAELKQSIDLYFMKKPRFVVSHEAPAAAGRELLLGLVGQYFTAKGECCNSRTSNALQRMLELHQPEEWVFGHYHVDKTFQLQGLRTKFTCVAELSTYDLHPEVRP